jgi:hypothetical protein
MIACKWIEDKADAEVEFEDKETNKFESVAINVEVETLIKGKNGKEAAKKAEAKTKGPHSGSFTNGKLYHQGKVTYKTGDKYEGEFKDGRPCGKGKMKYVGSLPGPTGGAGDFEEATYDGDWKAGKRDGQGIMKWADGSCFRGAWRNDMRHDGEMKMAN